MNIKSIAHKINQVSLQLHDINSKRSVGAMLTSTVQGTNLLFPMSSQKDLSYVHLFVPYLLLLISVINGKAI